MPSATPHTTGIAAVEAEHGCVDPGGHHDHELVAGLDGRAVSRVRHGLGHHELQLPGNGEGLEHGLAVDDPHGEGVGPVLDLPGHGDGADERTTATVPSSVATTGVTSTSSGSTSDHSPRSSSMAASWASNAASLPKWSWDAGPMAAHAASASPSWTASTHAVTAADDASAVAGDTVTGVAAVGMRVLDEPIELSSRPPRRPRWRGRRHRRPTAR